jgi:hypothetical protein
MTHAAKWTRKSEKRSSRLHRDLAVYALAAGAAGVSVLALASSAGAEVIYTPVNQTINAHQGYAIDLNQDGIVDFRIQNLFKRQSVRGYPYSSAIELMAVPADGVQAGYSQYEAGALPSGANIGPIQPTKPYGRRGALMAEQFRVGSFGTYYFGSWLDVPDRYLGLAFNVDGETHFGWARLKVHWNYKWTLSARITGYAYETVPNKPIAAGDTGSGSADSESAEPPGAMFEAPTPQTKPASLGALALGAAALEAWRPR